MPGEGETENSKNDDDFVDAEDELDAERMEESAAMSCAHRARGLINNMMGDAAEIKTERTDKSASMERLQRARVLINHTTETVAEINTEGIEESVEMARSQSAMGIIDHATEDVNYIFGEDGVGWGVGVGLHWKRHLSCRDWMIHGGQERVPQNDC